ncbi:MAG: ATP-binding protein, partial [Desulfosalsimonas sp.]
DVGTNAEVLLGNRKWLVACAGAAGPALEGGVSEIGMTAGPGVIDSVRIDTDTRQVVVHTIDDMPAKGICGSGMIDLAAQLFLSGMVDIRGVLVPEACGERLKETDGMRHFILVSGKDSSAGEDLTISQADLNSLIRSKAAMYTILETITGYVGISFNDISAFYVAGTFGSFINPRSAISIGMLPDLPEEIFRPLGNSSLQGATRLLGSYSASTDIESIRKRITYLELNVNQDFMNRFSAAKFLPHTDAGRFPSVVRAV